MSGGYLGRIVRFEDYRGRKRYCVTHPQHGSLTIAAPDEACAIVAAAKYWGERWQAYGFLHKLHCHACI